MPMIETSHKHADIRTIIIFLLLLIPVFQLYTQRHDMSMHAKMLNATLARNYINIYNNSSTGALGKHELVATVRGTYSACIV